MIFWFDHIVLVIGAALPTANLVELDCETALNICACRNNLLLALIGFIRPGNSVGRMRE